MRDRDLDADVVAGPDAAAVEPFAVAPDDDFRAPGRHAGILDPKRDRLILADDAETRRGDEHHAAVALVLASGDERVHGGGEAERRGVARDVVHAAVGDEDRAGDTVRRHIGERRAERRE